MKDFDELIQEEIAAFTGEHAGCIAQAPALFRLLINMLGDPSLTGRLRPMVIAAIGYFVLPADIIPEDLQGPHGYADDIFLAAFVADRVRQALGSEAILVDNWEGEGSILALVDEILDLEADLIGDKLELILWYIGYEHILQAD
jgi:uncharacterized membrane protein YkvA (DUF1232 family)